MKFTAGGGTRYNQNWLNVASAVIERREYDEDYFGG